MLERIQKANDIKKLAPEELPELAQEIRQFLIFRKIRLYGMSDISLIRIRS